jgi:type IV pilus assembly protein PilQ
MIKDLTKSAQVDTSGNALILRTSTKVLDEVREVVARVDRPVPQVMLEAKLIEVVVGDQELMGVDWARLNKITNILAENGKVRQDWMTPDDWGNPSSNQGWKNNAGGPWVWMNEIQTARGALPQTAPFQPLDLENMGHFSRQMTAFDVTLNFMLRNNKASVLAASKVATLNNRPANIAVVDVVSYVFNAGGQTQQITVKEQEVGIKLSIRPSINPEGWITTEVSPEVSSIVDWIGPNSDIPQVKKRTATTTVRVKDSESIIIAGLLETQKTRVVNRLPILSKLPFVGGLFRSNEERIVKTDLVIQITPRILMPEGTHVEPLPANIQAIEDELRLDDLIQDNDK